MRFERNDALSQQTARSTKRRLFVAAATMLCPIAATFLLLTGSVAFADDEVVQREVIAATAAWAEAINALSRLFRRQPQLLGKPDAL